MTPSATQQQEQQAWVTPPASPSVPPLGGLMCEPPLLKRKRDNMEIAMVSKRNKRTAQLKQPFQPMRLLSLDSAAEALSLPPLQDDGNRSKSVPTLSLRPRTRPFSNYTSGLPEQNDVHEDTENVPPCARRADNDLQGSVEQREDDPSSTSRNVVLDTPGSPTSATILFRRLSFGEEEERTDSIRATASAAVATTTTMTPAYTTLPMMPRRRRSSRSHHDHLFEGLCLPSLEDQDVPSEQQRKHVHHQPQNPAGPNTTSTTGPLVSTLQQKQYRKRLTRTRSSRDSSLSYGCYLFGCPMLP
eukprot:CAMPEP_0178747766 /NCGR_PEP_ID=MMETSP0744-20121128/8512_1 /TAXON_ID=913974 /ORGANISM="Nitzschia punctata, Strain CCMP561" /LENGTH=300 /DNA_ID=CAMNT_0020401055 /DNA_START=327 /DNA_END=1229 /DNA_ORIENTATION=-